MFIPLLQTTISISPTTITNAQILGGIVTVLWTLELIDTLLLGSVLNRLGIRPRQKRGIKGIVLAPLLHGNLKHLSTNTMPLVVMGGLILFLQSQQTFWIVTAVVWLISGVGTWLFGGPRTNHIGASGIVFGYFGFLLLQAYFNQNVVTIGIATIVILLYGGIIWGVLPIKRGRSWQGHLFGAIGGGLAAKYLPYISQVVTTTIEQLQPYSF